MKRIICFGLAVLAALMLCCCKGKITDEQTDISQDNTPDVEENVEITDPENTDEDNNSKSESETESQEENSESDDITNQYEVPGEYSVTLYFPDSDFLYLHPETRNVLVSEGQNIVTVLVNELFKGPESSELAIALTGDDLINSVSVSADGICTIDFKGDFAVLNTGGTTGEAFAIGSIVNSVCELDGIEKVKFNIDGNDKAEFGGHNTLEAPISPQTDLIKK